MQGLNNLIIRWSRPWWVLLAAAVGSVLSFQALRRIGERFAAVTAGYRPFDLQNPLSLGDILAQLPGYTARSRSLYMVFIVVDMIFPLVAALSLALLLAKVLRSVGRQWATRSLRQGLALTPLLAAVLDWLENACFVATITWYPQDITIWATMAIAMKISKIGVVLGCNAAIAGLTLYAGVRWLVVRRRRSTTRAEGHTAIHQEHGGPPW